MVTEEKVYPNGKPVSITDLLAAAEPGASVEYTRTPGFKTGQVFVLASVSSGEMIEWGEANEGEAKRTAGLRLIVRSVVDGVPATCAQVLAGTIEADEGATGRRVMDDTHIALLRKLQHKTTENVVRAIIKHNGMNIKLDDAKKD